MKLVRVISTAVLFLLLGTTIPAFAQKGQEEKSGGGGKAQQAQHQQQPQHTQQAQHQQQPQRAQQAQHQQQPQHAQQAQHQQQPQRVKQAQHQQQPQRAQKAQHTQQAQRSQRTQQAQRRGGQQGQRVAYNRGNNGNHYGRIPDDHYRAHFGRGHSFRMIRPRMINGYQRFQYSGYWFGFNEPWPSGWYYTDDVYVEYAGGAYYLYNPRHPGIHITLNLF